MKAVILLSVLAVAFARECGENEHFERCGTACPLTCENYQNPPKICVLSCNIGCHCDEGYVRSADGRCIKPEECPAAADFTKVCGENERFETCGTACPLTCDNYQNPPKACVKRCDIGCHCEEGYVRAANGKCVKPEECPAIAPMQCGENQHYEECGTACPLTCKNFDNPPKVCVMMCRSGCFCDKGFVKTDDGKCVRPEQCPEQAVCGENQRYLECGTACPLTCDNYNNPPKICPAMCVSGCHCEPGYVKTREGRCVRAEDCPSKSIDVQCKSDEQYYPDIPVCRKACKNYNNPAPMCPQYFVPRPGCFCKEGLWKRHDGKCVRPEYCSPSAYEFCQLPANEGPCRGYFPRYFFNQETGKCEKFIYGGCEGNQNSFDTLDECYDICGSS